MQTHDRPVRLWKLDGRQALASLLPEPAPLLALLDHEETLLEEILQASLTRALAVSGAQRRQNRRARPVYRNAFTFSAAARVIPGTCMSSSSEACRMAGTEPKCFSRAAFRFGPMPGTSSSCERIPFCCRRRR